jgi:hypothetical protein
MSERRVLVGQSETVEPNLIDVQTNQRENPYPDTATVTISDAAGTRREVYTQGKLVAIEGREFNTSDSWQRQITGIVAEAREREEQGADILEVEVHDVDTLVRGNAVTEDLSGQSISAALEQIIKDETPATWNAANVEVEEDNNVTRSFLEEKIDNVIKIFSRRSAGEIWGVNKDLEFFFRPPETKKLDNALDGGDIFHWDLPERGEAPVNEVRAFYAGGNKVTTVDDAADKERLQEELGTSAPVTLSQSLMLENVSREPEAAAQAEEKLASRSSRLVGTASTLDYAWLLAANPGDTVDLTIPDVGFSGVVRVVELSSQDYADRVDITFVETDEEPKGYEDDFQVQIEDTLKRVEMRPATGAQQDDNVDQETRRIETEVRGKLELQGDVGFDVPLDKSTVTKYGFNELRDSWIGKRTWNADQIAIGTGTSKPSRSDTALDNEVETVGVSVATSGPNAVTFTTASDFTATETITEIGLKDSSAGELLVRATLAEGTSADGEGGSIGITVLNDDSVEQGVLTQTGQETARDIIADNSPDFSTDFAVGSGTTAVDETDTALATEEDSRAIGNAIVKDLTTDALFNEELSGGFGQTDPLRVDGDAVTLSRTAHVVDAAGADHDGLFDNVGFTVSDSSYTGGEALPFEQDNDIIYDFTLNHRIPDGSLAFGLRLNDTGNDFMLRAEIEGPDGFVDLVDFSTTRSSIGWFTQPLDGSLGPGSCTLRINGEATGNTGEYTIDALVVYDRRYHDPVDFDNSISAGGFLDSPPEFTPQAFAFDTAELQEPVTSATIDATLNDTSGDQYLSIEGNQTANSSSASASGFNSTTQLDYSAQLGGFGSRTDKSPTQGFTAQELQALRLSIGTSGLSKAGQAAVKVESNIPPDVINGVDLTEAGTKDITGDLQTRSRFAATPVDPGVQIINQQVIRFSPDERPVNQSDFDPTITDSSEVDTTGTNVLVSITGGQQQ